MNESIPDRLSVLCDPIFEEAVDIAIEQHRLNDNKIAQCDSNGNVIEIASEDITPLSIKLKKQSQSPTKVKK